MYTTSQSGVLYIRLQTVRNVEEEKPSGAALFKFGTPASNGGRRCGPRCPALNGVDVQWCDRVGTVGVRGVGGREQQWW